MTKIWTPKEIVDRIVAMNPKASSVWNQASDPCTTDIIECVRIEGVDVPLTHKNGKHAAGYIRVSTDVQREAREEGDISDPADRDGFSEGDQAARLVDYFTHPERRYAFRLVSDAGLSGGLPIKDERLIRQMINKKADRYATAFERVWYQSPNRTSQAVEAQAKFLEHTVASILSGANVLGAVQDVEGEVVVMPEVTASDLDQMPVIIPSAGKSTKPLYRPGLTHLMRTLVAVHEVAATDWSRISRSYALSVELGEAFRNRNHRVNVKGIVEDMRWIKQEDFGDEFYAFFITKMAEHKLYEVTLNTLRGMKARLEAGYPISQSPFWIAKLGKRRYDLDPIGTYTLRRMTELYLSEDGDDDRGWQKVADALNADPDAMRPPKRKTWNINNVSMTLRHGALDGKVEHFGLQWQVYPPAIGQAQIDRVKARIAHRVQIHAYNKPHKAEGYTAAGIVYCWCGKALGHRELKNGMRQYICRATSAEKREGNRRHMLLSAPDVEEWFGEIIESHPDVALRFLPPSAERAALIEEVQRLTDDLVVVESHLNRAEADAERIARADLDAAGVTHENSMHDQMFDLTRQHHKARIEASDRKLMADLKVLIAEKEHLLITHSTFAELPDIEEKMRDWQSMTGKQRNELLHTVFGEFRTEGDPPTEKLVPRIRRAQSHVLPVIPIRTRQRGGQLVRRLQPVQEWIRDMDGV